VPRAPTGRPFVHGNFDDPIGFEPSTVFHLFPIHPATAAFSGMFTNRQRGVSSSDSRSAAQFTAILRHAANALSLIHFMCSRGHLLEFT
jgi:hypothetical protein